MDIITVIAYFVIGSASIVYLFFKIKFSYWKKLNVPHLEPKIPFGNLTTRNVHFTKFLENIYNEFKGKVQFAGAYFLFNPVAIIIDLDLCKQILIKNFQYFTDRGMFYNEKDDPLSAHLFNLDGDKWKGLRAKLTPTFTSGKMKFMFPTVVEVGNRFQQILSEILQNNNEIEMKDLLARFTSDVIGTCAFGIDCNSLKDPNADFLKFGRLVFEDPNRSRFYRIFIQQFKQLARTIGMKRNRDDVSKFFLGVVKETVDYREKNNIRRNDFMDLLIELKNGDKENESLGRLTIEEVAAQAFVFFLAGFETSSTTMAFCLYELALNQDIQNRLRNEINSVLDKHKQNFTYEAMTEMTYLEQTIDESLRKYPPGIALQRKAIADFKVPNTNYVIEKGTSVMIPVYSIQRDPEYYPEPEKFDPDRFNPNIIKERHSLSFLPFGDGPRNCIGLRFGKMQARIGLVILLKHFKFSTCPKTQIPLEFSTKNLVLSPKDGFWLKVQKV